MLRVDGVKRSGVLFGLLALVALAGSSGCASFVGRWTGGSLAPEMARDQFKFLRPADQPGKFVSADVRLQQDGSYTAEVNYDGKIEQRVGTWKYDDKGFLVLNDKEGNSYAYALHKVDDQTIQLVKGIKGTDVTLTLKKQP
jgi:hypothetical protein